MNKRKLELLAAAVVSVTLIVGCGGGRFDRDSSAAGGGSGATGGGSGAAGGGSGAAGDIGTSLAALMAYMEGLIATDENGDPVDISSLTLAADDTTEALSISP